ncbi:MAG: hypothetical protein EOO55_02895, partial [Hymenobacter sp.]
MKSLWWLRFLFLLSVARLGSAQQLLCERTLPWPATQAGYRATGLLRTQPDSLRLVGDFSSSNSAPQALTTSLRRVLVAACDTLPVRGASWPLAGYIGTSQGLVTRRGQVLLSNSSPSDPTAPVGLRLLGRDGQPRWTRTLSLGRYQAVNALLEAPDRGFFVEVGTFATHWLVRLDSVGNTRWQKVVGQGGVGRQVQAATYTRTANLLLYGQFFGGVRLWEITQNGDTLRWINPVVAPAQATPNVNRIDLECMQPLRDGGFLLLANLDSVYTGNYHYFRPLLIRLTATLQVVWTSVYRQQATASYRFSSPLELADGSLLVAARNAASGYQGNPYWLFRYSGSGQLL